MSELPKGPDSRRLDELAAVTKEYARYSRSKFGLGTTAMGLWLAATGSLLTGVSRTAGERMLIVSALVWLACVARARRYYQRHGEVVEAPEEGPGLGRAVWLGGVYLMSVMGVLRWAEQAPAVNLSFLLAAASFVAAPMLATVVTRGGVDTLETMVFVAWGSLRLGSEDEFGRWLVRMFIAIGVIFVVAGVREHARYRRLERRLAALKGSA